jgi:hypothetical protein
MLFPGQVIELNDRDLEALGIEVSRIVDDYETTYAPLFNDLTIWWKWHDAVPRQKTKSWPFLNASNIVVPLIEALSDSLVARLYGSIFGQTGRIWMGKTLNENEQDKVNEVIRFINWAANNNDFNYRLSIYDWLSELVPIGSSVLEANWRNDVRMAFASQGRGKSRNIVAQPVRFARGPNFEHVPREQILWDTAVPISEAPVIIREYNYSWSHINHLATVNPGWNKKAVEQIQGRSSGSEGPSQKVREEKERAESRVTAPDLFEEHDVRNVTLDWPVLRSMGFEPTKIVAPNKEKPGQPSIPVVVTLHRRTRQVLWVRAFPYFFPQKNYFDGYMRKRSGRGHAVGLAKRLYGMQEGITALVNQAIDARTRANSVWAKTTRRDMLTKPIDPSHPIYVGADMNSFQELKLDTNNFQDLSMVNILNIFAERLAGQADPNFGREQRQGGHPSPATSTIALLGEGEKMALPTRDLIRMQISRMGEAAASMYQQFETNEDGRIQRVLGDRDAAKVEEFLFPTDPISSVMNFDVVAMNESTNPQAEMAKAVTVTQMNTNYWAFVLRATQVMQQSAQNPLVLEMAVKSIEAQTKAHMRFLEASDVDDIESFVLELNRGIEQGTAQLQAAAGGLGELAAGNGAVQGQGAVDGGAGPNGRGSLVAPGGIGL